MSTFIRWIFRTVVALILLVIVLAVAGVLLKDTLAKSFAEKNLRDNTGMDAKIEKMEVGLATPTVSMEGLKLYNTADFGGGTFLEMPELRIEYIPGEVRDGKLHLKTVRLNLAMVHIVKGKDGKTNLELLQQQAKNKSPVPKDTKDKGQGGKPAVEFGGIDTLYLTLGKLKITDLANPENDQEINLGLKDEVGRNLQTEAELTGWFAGVVFKIYLQEMMTNPDAQKNLRSLFEGPKKPKRAR